MFLAYSYLTYSVTFYVGRMIPMMMHTFYRDALKTHFVGVFLRFIICQNLIIRKFFYSNLRFFNVLIYNLKMSLCCEIHFCIHTSISLMVTACGSVGYFTNNNGKLQMLVINLHVTGFFI